VTAAGVPPVSRIFRRIFQLANTIVYKCGKSLITFVTLIKERYARLKQCESLADRLQWLILIKLIRIESTTLQAWSAPRAHLSLLRFQRPVNCLRVPTKNSLLTSPRNIAAASRVNECSREKSIYGPSGESKNTIAVKLSWYMYIGIRPGVRERVRT